MAAIQAAVQALHVVVHATPTVTTHLQVQAVAVLGLLAAHHVRHTVRIHLITLEVALALLVAPHVAPYVKTLPTTHQEVVLVHRAPDNVRENVPRHVHRHVQAIAPKNVVTAVPVTAEVVAKIRVREVVVVNVEFRVAGHVAGNARLDVPLNAST